MRESRSYSYLEEDDPINDNFELKLVEKKNKFPEAEALGLCRDEEDNPKVVRYMLIVNKENHSQEFTVVTKGYKIVQHDAVYDAVMESIDKLGLNFKPSTILLNEGGRLRLICDFNDVHLTIGTERLKLRVTYDNSYNCTTGLRMEIGATIGNRYMMIGEKKCTYYHRHTKGLLVADLLHNLEKGKNVFENQYQEIFNNMFTKSITEINCRVLLDKWIEKKTIAVKYLEMIKSVIVNNGFEDISKHEPISNFWLLYNVVSEVISNKVESVDTQRRYLNIMFEAISREIK